MLAVRCQTGDDEEMTFLIGGAGWTRFTLVAGAVGLFACGSDPQGDSAPGECRQFVQGYCAKMVECALPSDRSRAQEDCDFNFEVSLSCDDVVAVMGSMPNCLHDMAAIDCSTVDPRGSWPEVPASCKILVIR
jgi:hypothetical protein